VPACWPSPRPGPVPGGVSASTQASARRQRGALNQFDFLAAHLMLTQFKDVSWNAMNSFVHGGIHPLRHSVDGFPVHLALQVLRNFNGLSTMTGMTMAGLTGEESIVKLMTKIQPTFADGLPDLLNPESQGVRAALVAGQTTMGSASRASRA